MSGAALLLRLAVLPLAALLWLLPMMAAAQPAKHTELQELYMADQRDRINSRGKPWDPAVDQRDRERRARAEHLLKSGELHTATDFYNIAMLFQHGETADDFRLAHAMAWLAYTMREDGVPKREAGWLAAAALDRLLIHLGKPQWYGTQYHRDPATNRPGERFPYDPEALSDAERNKLLAPIYN